jgi:modulator of FtsH protease HflC
MKTTIRVLAALAILLLVSPFFAFVISERELAVVLRLGNPVREYSKPGIHFRIPFFEAVQRLPKTKQYWGGMAATPINDVNTNDNKKIDLTPWAVWRIQSPTTFVQRLRTIDLAEQRVAQITRSAIRDVIGQYDLAEVVRTTDRPLPSTDDSLALVTELTEITKDALPDELKSLEKPVQPSSIKLGRTKLLDLIRAETKKRLTETVEEGGADGVAIEIIDVGISQLMFVASVRQKTFDRWVSEREAISMLIVKEGEKKKAKILNAARAEGEKIQGMGQKEASETKGKADAEVIRKYAEVIGKDPEFFSFVRTLQAYEKSIGEDTRLILSTDSEFLRLLQNRQSGFMKSPPPPTGTQPPATVPQ